MTDEKFKPEPTLYEASVAGRCGVALGDSDVPSAELPAGLLRDDNGQPELSQIDVVRHYLRLSQRNFGVDSGFYPLGSCTMKYNPKLIDEFAGLEGFADTHPLQDLQQVQGNLALIYRLQNCLSEIGGFQQTSLAPTAGAQGELSALLMIRAYHRDRGDLQRRQILIPDSAHGTNPASTAMAGFSVTEIPTDPRGNINLDALNSVLDDTVAGLMITNPNTLGLFEQQIEAVCIAVHDCGGLVYGDGANMNALTGIVRPADLGIDLMHYNLHKTFATPHGGGGPGAGPLATNAALAPYLPGPLVTSDAGEQPEYGLMHPTKSIGRMSTFFGNFATFVRAYAYIRLHGGEGLRQNAFHAVLNANYLRARLRDCFTVSHDDRMHMHEFVCQGRFENSPVRALDISKRLMDYGFHPPTNYFPLIVPEALMIEPTETESKQTLDEFIAAMKAIAAEALEKPEVVLSAPYNTPVKRLDEVKAARRLVLTDHAMHEGPDHEE